MLAKLLLFALAKEKAGKPFLTLELPEPATLLDLKQALTQHCPALASLLPILRFAINSEYAIDDDQPIPPDAELAAIPPVSGGSTHSSTCL